MAERPLIQLGPRAALLLGLLGEPLTTGEVYTRLEAARDLLDLDAIGDVVAEFLGGVRSQSPAVTVDQLLDGGLAEIRRQLHRLEDAGYARHLLGDRDGLWWRVPPAEW